MLYFSPDPVFKCGYLEYKFDKRLISYDLYRVTEYDTRYFVPKKGCQLFRVNSGENKGQLIVSLNVERKLLYFLEDYDVDTPIKWETRAVKLSLLIMK